MTDGNLSLRSPRPVEDQVPEAAKRYIGGAVLGCLYAYVHASPEDHQTIKDALLSMEWPGSESKMQEAWQVIKPLLAKHV